MRRVLPCLFLGLLAACSDVALKPVTEPAPAADAPRSAMREMIRRQLDSRQTEPPPEPAPAREAEQLGRLRDLPPSQGFGRNVSTLRATQ